MQPPLYTAPKTASPVWEAKKYRLFRLFSKSMSSPPSEGDRFLLD